jgi:salicylate hydroxylase
MGETSLRVAIIGAGIGGLSLGLALREPGLRADVFEQASELAEIGAAISARRAGGRDGDVMPVLGEP